MSARLKSKVRFLATGVCVIAALVGTGWVGFRAGQTATSVSPAQPAPPSRLTLKVAQGSLTDATPMNIRLSWTTVSELRNQLPGLVTRVAVRPGVPSQITAGSALYWVDEAPVMVMQGDVPAYRALSAGANGRDVAQVQSFLASAGVYQGDQDGRWRASTTTALRAWQRSLDLPVTETLPLGSVLFLSQLPVSVSIAPQFSAGVHVDAGTPVVSVVGALPLAQLVVPNGTTRDVRSSTIVAQIGSGNVTFRADGAATLDPQTNQTLVGLSLAESSTSCDAWCDQVGTAAPLVAPATVTFGGPASGPMLPIGALQTTAGDVTVTMESGESKSVQIVLQVDGQAIVDGLSVGDVVLIPTVGP